MDSRRKIILGLPLVFLVLAILGVSTLKKLYQGKNGPHPLGSIAEVPRLPSHRTADKRAYDFPLINGAIFKQEKWDGQVYIIFGRMTESDFQGLLSRFDLKNQIMRTRDGLKGLHIGDEVNARKYPDWIKSRYDVIADYDDVISFEGSKDDASISGVYSSKSNEIGLFLGY